MSVSFAEKNWSELEKSVISGATVLIPVGILEEHGPHLPVNCDAVIAERVTVAAAEKLAGEIEVLVLPTIWTGYTAKELMRWPGTVRIGTRTFLELTKDITLSLLDMGFRRICFVNGHGQHPALLETVIREIADERGVYLASADVAKLAAEKFTEVRRSPPGGAIHGCEFETSLMLYLEPSLVDMSKAHNSDMMRYASPFIPGDGFAGSKKVFVSTWGLQRSQSGIYGDPTVASKETGQVVFEAAVEKLMEWVREFQGIGVRDEMMKDEK